jgi:hypothetical protein
MERENLSITQFTGCFGDLQLEGEGCAFITYTVTPLFLSRNFPPLGGAAVAESPSKEVSSLLLYSSLKGTALKIGIRSILACQMAFFMQDAVLRGDPW